MSDTQQTRVLSIPHPSPLTLQFTNKSLYINAMTIDIYFYKLYRERSIVPTFQHLSIAIMGDASAENLVERTNLDV
jgi:hypothetical protein